MKLGLLSAPRIGAASIGAVLDPWLRPGQAAEVPTEGSGSQIPKRVRLASTNELIEISKKLGYPDIEPEGEELLDDLDLFNQISRGQAELERMSDIEVEILETQKWNYDAVVQLLNVALGAKNIPFGTRAELFDLKPTAEEKPSRKGKEKEKEKTEASGSKRAIFNISPEAGKPFWCGSPDRELNKNFSPPLLIWWLVHPMPPMIPVELPNKTKEFLDKKLPEIFGDNVQHNCDYRNLLFRYVKEDIQHKSNKKLIGEFLLLI